MLLSLCAVIINYPPDVVKRKAGRPFMMWREGLPYGALISISALVMGL